MFFFSFFLVFRVCCIEFRNTIEVGNTNLKKEIPKLNPFAIRNYAFSKLMAVKIGFLRTKLHTNTKFSCQPLIVTLVGLSNCRSRKSRTMLTTGTQWKRKRQPRAAEARRRRIHSPEVREPSPPWDFGRGRRC